MEHLTWLSFVLFVLGTIGLTNTIVHGMILDVIGLRPWLREHMPNKLFAGLECHECTGFWCGMIMGIVVLSYNPAIFIPCGFAGGVVAQFYNDFTYLLHSKTEYEIGDSSEQNSQS